MPPPLGITSAVQAITRADHRNIGDSIRRALRPLARSVYALSVATGYPEDMLRAEIKRMGKEISVNADGHFYLTADPPPARLSAAELEKFRPAPAKPSWRPPRYDFVQAPRSERMPSSFLDVEADDPGGAAADIEIDESHVQPQPVTEPTAMPSHQSAAEIAVPAGQRLCRGECQAVKDMTEFPKHGSSLGGRTRICKKCTYKLKKNRAEHDAPKANGHKKPGAKLMRDMRAAVKSIQPAVTGEGSAPLLIPAAMRITSSLEGQGGSQVIKLGADYGQDSDDKIVMDLLPYQMDQLCAWWQLQKRQP